MRNVYWTGLLLLLSFLPSTWEQGVDVGDISGRVVVFPHRVDVNGIKYAGKHFQKRSVRETWDEEVRYRFETNGKQYEFNVRYTDDFLVPGLVVQRYSDNHTWLEEEASASQGSPHCFYSGKVNGAEWSQVTISVCDGLTGMFSVGSEKFLIEPHRNENFSDYVKMDSDNDSVVPHLLYRLTHSQKHSQSENASICGVHTENYKHRRRKKMEEDSIEDLNLASSSHSNIISSHHVHKRSVSMKNYVEVMVAADFKMAAYHKENIQHYILTLMSIVNSIYRNRTIANFIHIVVVKIIVFNSERDGPRITTNAGDTLKRFCNWQYRNNDHDDNSPNHHDTAILLTREDICRAPNKCDTLGLAELGTMCDPNRSCAIIEDNGISAAYTIAHELGHVFDLPHDDDNRCRVPVYDRDPKAKTHVMSPTIDGNTDPWSWSECSSRLLTKFFDAGYGKCLEDSPKVKRYKKRIKKMQRLLPGHLYKANTQCELVYGKGYHLCPFMRGCNIMWCTNSTDYGCRTQHMPMADGTECGIGKICMRGDCVKKKPEKMVHGGWSKWRRYGRCTRTCGGGIKKASRECDNPEPKNGGRYCTGKRVKYRHCNIKPCPPNSDDFRVQQCAEYNSQIRYYNITPGSRWIPKYDGIQEKDWCKLYCKADSSPSHFYMLNHKVIDGTKCRPDGDDICVNGQCRRGGCDNKLGSRMKRDWCGVCGGDNASCKTISGVYNSVRYGYQNVALIPAGATNIDIRQHGYRHLSDDENYLALTNSSGDYLLNGKFIISMHPQEIKVLGGSLHYSGSKTLEERINSTGTLYEDLHLQVLSIGKLNPPKIQYSYTTSLSEDIRFIWEEDTVWSDCDSLCNGKRYRKVKCVRDLDRTAVSDQRCENQPKPQTESQRCNQHCKISWHAGQYECSAHCGSGIAKQDVSCVMQNRYNITVIDEKHCVKRSSEIGKRPVERVVCYGKCLETLWKYSDWSQCTASCGGGAQKRTAVCMDVRGNQLEDHLCSEKEVVLKRSCNSQACAAWLHEDWTGCSVTCGHGNRHRKVTCNQGNEEVMEHLCNDSPRPTSKLDCYMGPCPAWVEGSWGQCSSSCDKGVAQRTVECQSSAGQVLEDIRCDATMRPYETRPCNLGNCITTSNPTTPVTTTTQRPVSWNTGSWSQCSSSCGEGFKQRYVQCMDDGGNVYDVSQCNHLTKPSNRESCIQRACGYWRTGEWNDCSVTCGSGTQTRYVACTLMDRQPADEVQCDMDIKPESERTCYPGECIPVDQYDIGVITRNTVVGISHWRIGPWSGCSSSCGMGWQRRQVLCRDEKGPNDSCDMKQKPETRQTCDSGPCPHWVHGEWTACSESCGDNGMQKRVVLCHSGEGHPLGDSECDVFERPPESRMCNNGPCNQNHSWQVGPWSPCSVTCGRGHCQREVLCVSENGDIQPSTECQGKKPRNTKQCKLTNCPSWFTGPWSRCSVSCGQGTRHRDVKCKMGLGDVVPNDLCARKRQPKSETKCERKKCSEYMWKITEWSKCSKPCGFGMKTRDVYCTDREDNPVEDDLCDQEKKPKMKRRCSEFPCPFMWNTGPWSECSATCGEGQQTRRAICQAVTKEGWIMTGEVPYGCKDSDKPAEIQTCNYGFCNATNYWVTAPWGECSARCGRGFEHRQVQCLDLKGRQQSKKNCSRPHKPPKKRPCYNRPCFATSCKQLKEQTSIRQDGSYKLSVQGRLIEIYCKNMKKTMPEEFLSLPAGEQENFSEVYPYRLKRPGTCPNNGSREDPCTSCRHLTYRNKGFTSYSRIKIDIVALKVIASDLTFASSQQGKNIPYGSAGDCYSARSCPQGNFKINLSGTGLVVARNTTWLMDGANTSQRILRKQEGEIVEGVCGGLCGWCSPDSSIGLQLDVLP